MVKLSSEETYKIGNYTYNVDYNEKGFRSLYIFDNDHNVISSYSSLDEIKEINKGLTELLTVIDTS